MSVELRNVELGDGELGSAERVDGASSGAIASAAEAGQLDFHVSPVMAAVSAGVLGVAAVAYYLYGHLTGS